MTPRSRYRGCLLAGAVGDALGAPVEFWSLARIREACGPEGVTGYLPLGGRRGLVTDDTQMTLFTAEGLVRAHERGRTKGIVHVPEMVHDAYLRWLQTQGERSAHPRFGRPARGGLIDVPAMHARRAPGNTCLSALRGAEMGRPDRPLNDSKGCGGVMRAAPVGLSWVEDPFRIGCEISALTHGHPSGWLTAGVLARLIRDLVDGAGLDGALDHAVAELRSWPGNDETLAAIEAARRLARTAAPVPETVERLGGGWVAEEALAIALFCALAHPDDLRAALRLAVTHSGDSDSTGALTGNLLGAHLGDSALPADWLAPLELRAEITALADTLHTTRFDPPPA